MPRVRRDGSVGNVDPTARGDGGEAADECGLVCDADPFRERITDEQRALLRRGQIDLAHFRILESQRIRAQRIDDVAVLRGIHPSVRPEVVVIHRVSASVRALHRAPAREYQLGTSRVSAPGYVSTTVDAVTLPGAEQCGCATVQDRHRTITLKADKD